jgi:hypothetical protein
MSSDQPLDDANDTLDQQLRILLSVEPSPQFLVRVRDRIATDAAPGFWHGWHVRFAVPLALLALLGTVMLNRETAVTPPPERAHDVQRDSASATTSLAEPEAPITVPPSVVVERRPRPPRAAASHVEPPAVMPAGEMQALQAFLDEIQTRRTTIPAIVAAEPAAVAALAIDDIDVPVIDIAPLTIPALQGSTQ